MRCFRLLLPAAAVLAISLSSCLTYYPNLIKTPLFAHKGETHLGGYLTNSGVDATAGYAIGESAAVLGSASMGFKNDSGSTSTHAFGELAVGTFTPVAPRLTSETFLGAGYGQSYTLLSGGPGFGQAGNYMRGFVSSSVAYAVGSVDLGVAARIAAIDFVTGRDFIDNRPFGLFIEPAAFGRIGWERLKLDGQIGMSWHIFSNPGFGAQKLFCGIGAHIILPSLRN